MPTWKQINAALQSWFEPQTAPKPKPRPQPHNAILSSYIEGKK